MKTEWLVAVAAVAIAPTGLAQNPGPERLNSVEIRSEKVGDGLYVLFGFGGAMAVSIGEQGVLAVDTQFPELVPKINAEIEKLGGGAIDFAVNTHWHYDHADGNMGFGPLGVWFVAQTESARRLGMDNVINPMTRPAFAQPAYPVEARPIVSFDSRMQFNFNGGIVDLIHFGPAHTGGDAAVFFRKHNAVHMGDVFTPRGYPFVDVDNGGDIDGMITSAAPSSQRSTRIRSSSRGTARLRTTPISRDSRRCCSPCATGWPSSWREARRWSRSSQRNRRLPGTKATANRTTSSTASTLR